MLRPRRPSLNISRLSRLDHDEQQEHSSNLETPMLPVNVTSPEKISFFLADSSSTFLTALAAQERRVLELKEELEKAEDKLEKLKKHWAIYEVTKKRNEIRHLEQLQPISPPIDIKDVEIDQLASIGRENDRQKPVPGERKQTQRKVFSGSKHTRALSLLSPSLSASHRTASPTVSLSPIDQRLPGTSISRSATVPAIEVSTATSVPSNNDPPQDLMIETGRQFVGDLRQGLRTFFEDLRQATVGNEAVNGATSRDLQKSMNSKTARIQNNSLKARNLAKVGDLSYIPKTKSDISERKSIGVIGTFNSEKRSQGQFDCDSKRGGSTLPKVIDDSELEDDGWNNWESPKSKVSSPRSSRSMHSSISEQSWSPPNEKSSSRTSARYECSQDHACYRLKFYSSSTLIPRPTKDLADKRDNIPWPDILKSSPGNLKRTASTLMSEWEASLTPPRIEGLGLDSSKPLAAAAVKKAD